MVEEERLFFKFAAIDFEWKNPYSASKISRAVHLGNYELVKKLIRKGYNLDVPDNRGWTPLHEASVSDRNVRIADLLISAGAYIEHKTVEGDTALFKACQHGSENIVRILLEAGSSVNVRNSECVTPLHIACTQKNPAIIKLLLDHGADMEAKDNEERSPIHIAVENVNTEAMRILIQHGANLETKDFFSRTPLHYACMVGNIEVFNILLAHLGFDKSVIDQQTPEGWTLLMEACQYKNLNIAKKLIEYGTDTTLVDNRGLLALHIAAHCDHFPVFKYILMNTPEKVIEQYSTFGHNMTHYRSLPCLIIDKNVFDGLKLLFQANLSKEVLKCPAKMGENLLSPIGFLLLHANAIPEKEKIKYLDFLLSYDFLIDPEYERVDNESCVSYGRFISTIEAAIMCHHHEYNERTRTDCLCDKFLAMILARGASVDKIPDGLQSQKSNYFFFFLAARLTFLKAIGLLLRYSEQYEPDDILESYLIDVVKQKYQLYTGNEYMVTKYLCERSVKICLPRVVSIKNYLATLPESPPRDSKEWKIKEILGPVCNSVTSSINVVSLKCWCRLVVRKCVRELALSTSKPFRKCISDINLPPQMTRFLLYDDDEFGEV